MDILNDTINMVRLPQHAHEALTSSQRLCHQLMQLVATSYFVVQNVWPVTIITMYREVESTVIDLLFC